MTSKIQTDISQFLPYLLNQAAEITSAEFQQHYRQKYGMLRTEWRVLFHLGQFGKMTAKQICEMSAIHKTKVSRAVQALEQKRLLKRETDSNDRRLEHLSPTKNGAAVFTELKSAAETYDEKLSSQFDEEEMEQLRASLVKLVAQLRPSKKGTDRFS